jgi:hypothetical protein
MSGLLASIVLIAVFLGVMAVITGGVWLVLYCLVRFERGVESGLAATP